MDLALALLLYFATAMLVLGLAWRVAQFLRTPLRLPSPVTPAPQTHTGVAWRLAKEVLVFASLFASNRWIWFFGWLFHASLVLVLLRHLRYFLEPVPAWVVWLQPLGRYAGLSMLLALLALWARRWLVARLRYISTVSDHLMLALLGIIALSGLMMSFVLHTDIVAVKQFTLGLLDLTWPTPPGGPLVAHLVAVSALCAAFPLSKLLHAPGLFFGPSRASLDQGRRPAASGEGA